MFMNKMEHTQCHNNISDIQYWTYCNYCYFCSLLYFDYIINSLFKTKGGQEEERTKNIFTVYTIQKIIQLIKQFVGLLFFVIFA